ncbi:hypothetical protein FZC66_16435 [Priestia megaterium]|nr:hypothetical protein FZC66_16435 [Priestia megaterium]
MLRKLGIMTLTMFLSFTCLNTLAAEKKETRTPATNIPSSALNISKENTYPNSSQDTPYLQPSELSQELLNTSNVKIENPDLIRILNETSISKTPWAIGFRATVYLGEWPLNYESAATNINWQYQKINTNHYDNRTGKSPYQMKYNQEAQSQVKGGLTAKIPQPEHVKQMMLLKAAKKTNLALSFQTLIGAGTKKDQVYNVAPKKVGYLYAYTPAVSEKGKVTYGEVYLTIKGSKRMITVKNVTSQGIGAWIPVQDYVSLSFGAYDQPR